MRILKFVVDNDRIYRNQYSNFDDITSADEIVADFNFIGTKWDGAIKVAAFFNADGECPPQELIDGMYCRIPKEAFNGYWFRVQILGNKNGVSLITNKLDVIQNGGIV